LALLATRERPLITPANFAPIPAIDLNVTELQDQWWEENFGHLTKPEYKPDADWTKQFVQSRTVQECFAEFNGTEFHHELKTSVLIPIYKKQYEHFDEVTAPRLADEGVSQIIIEFLRDVYHTRAHIDPWEVDATIAKFGRHKNFRVTTGHSSWWAEWKLTARSPFTGWLTSAENNPAEKLQGKYATNEQQARINVRQFRGISALFDAIDRGLTPQERAAVRAIVQEGGAPLRLSHETKSEIEADVQRLASCKDDEQKFNTEFVKIVKALGPGAKKTYFEERVMSVLGPTSIQLASNTPEDHDKDYVMREGVDYFTSEESRQGFLDAVRNQWVNVWNGMFSKIKNGKDEVVKKTAERFNDAVSNMFSDDVRADLELMSLLRGATLTERQQDEILQIFRGDVDQQPDVGAYEDHVLLDALNPHPVAMRLWGHRLRELTAPDVTYTEEFIEGSDTNFLREKDYTPAMEQLFENPVNLGAPSMPHGEFNTAQDEIYHFKLIRLAEDFYDLDLNTELGLMTFDHICHAYDISPGEDTLERCHSSPPDPHTYEELPIIKYDGWDECDDPPPEEEAFDPQLLEAAINDYLAAVASYTGSPAKTLKDLSSGASLDSSQVDVLRAILGSEDTDVDRVKLMKKVWSAVLPDREVEQLFGEKEVDLLAAADHHH